MTIGNNIRKFRQEKGFSQDYFGKKLGISQNAVHKMESGKKVPNIEELQKISEVLEISLEVLLSNFKIVENAKLIETYGFSNAIIIPIPEDILSLIKGFLTKNNS
jgi:transcriptional regulator with XRE-family HTH domain